MTCSVQVDSAPAYELVNSLNAFLQKKTHKTIALGPPWVSQVKQQVGPEWMQRFKDVEVPALDVLIWQCPGRRDADGFIDWLRSLSVGQLYELWAPYVPDGAPPMPPDLAGLRDEVADMLALFHDRYFRHVDPAILAHLAADAAAKQALAKTMAPVDLIDVATGGLRIEPDSGLERVVLVPQYHARPINWYTHCRGVTFYFYPVDVADHAPGDVPLALLRLTRALGDESRLRILRLLASGPLSFTDLVKRGHLAKSTVHHHLITLRAAGLIRVHVSGEGTLYTLRPEGLGALRLMLENYIAQGESKP